MHITLPTHTGKRSAICFSTWCKYLEMHDCWKYKKKKKKHMKSCLQTRGALTRRWSFPGSLRWTPPLYHVFPSQCSLPSALLLPTGSTSCLPHRHAPLPCSVQRPIGRHPSPFPPLGKHGRKTRAQGHVLHIFLLLHAPPAALLPYVSMTHFSVSPNCIPIPLCPPIHSHRNRTLLCHKTNICCKPWRELSADG